MNNYAGKAKKKEFFLGFLLGLFLPLVIAFVIQQYTKLPFYLHEFVKWQMYYKLLSLAALINLASFYAVLYFKKENAAKGIILASFCFAFLGVLLNWWY